MTARCWIDGVEVPLSAVMKRVMNFGQRIAALTPRRYRIEVPLDDLAARLDREHAQTVQELIADDDGADDVTNALRAAGWPSLDVLLRGHPQVADAYLRTYLFDVALDALATGRPDTAAYQLNTLASVRVVGESVVFEGEAYESSVGARRDTAE